MSGKSVHRVDGVAPSIPVPSLLPVALVVLVVCVLGVAGCTPEGPGASPSGSAAVSVPPVSASPAPASARIMVKPARPHAMDDDGPAGAEAAAMYFLKLGNYTQASGDTAEWEAMSHEACEFCTKCLNQARKIVANGYAFNGGDLTVDIIHTYAQDAATGIWPIDIRVNVTASEITNPAGEVVFSDDNNAFLARAEVARRGGQWVIVTIGNGTRL